MSVALRPPALSEGSLQQDPFAHLLLAAFEHRFNGSLVLWSGEQPFADNADQQRIRFIDGVVVAADLGQHKQGLLASLLPLNMRRAGGYRFLADTDLAGSAPHVLRGHVDPFMFLATALRGPVRDDVVEHVVWSTTGRVLRMRSGCPLERFGFTREEWEFVQELRRQPASLPELMAGSEAPDIFVKRMVYLLRVTGMLAVLPAGEQLESRAVSVPSPVESGRFYADPLARQMAAEAARERRARARKHTDTIDLLTQDEPFFRHERASNAQVDRDKRPAHVRVPSEPPAELSGDQAYRYRQIVRHHGLLRSRNLFEILGVGPEDDDQAIQDAYAVLEVQWRYERLPPALARLQPLVEEILAGLAEARDTLTDPARRYEYIERLRRGESRLMSLCRVEEEQETLRDTRPERPRRKVGNG